MFVVSLVINYVAGEYASAQAGSAVRDIILDQLPVFNVTGIFVYGIAAFFGLVAVLIVWELHKSPFVLKSISLFILVRSFFIILTHIGPSLPMAYLSINSIANYFTFTGDLFFSAHTGLPFLLTLIFWENKLLRFVFLAFSLGLGIVVLLGHLHYSIDVFSAFFITYGIFEISKKIFKKDYILLQQSLPVDNNHA